MASAEQAGLKAAIRPRECDRRRRVKVIRVVADGTADSCPLPMRDLLATVLRQDGHGFVIAHNHPSGGSTPSVADRAITLRCRTAAEVTGVTFLGHVVPSEHGCRGTRA